ncbi:MAG TPA: ABC transporter permease [Clostridiales bacterium]|nr:ABC transporter permease [Clostridiales bacterium]
MIQKIPLWRQAGFRLFLMVLPFLVLVFILAYLPLYGWVYAFFDYKPGMTFAEMPYAGLKYFKKLVQDKYAILDIFRVLKNTFAMNFLGYLFSPLAMLFAIFLSEIRSRKYQKTIQTVTTFPHFISWVLVYAMAFAMFSVNDGLVNKIVLRLGLIDKGINFLINPDYSWLKMTLWQLWKGLGWSAIIYFAALSGIDPELYQSAMIDGAGRSRMIWHITIPQLMPTYFVLLILSIASFLSTGMECYYIFSNPMNKAYLEVLDLYVYNQGIAGYNYPYSIAVGMLKSLVSIVLLFSANKLSVVIRQEGIV